MGVHSRECRSDLRATAQCKEECSEGGAGPCSAVLLQLGCVDWLFSHAFPSVLEFMLDFLSSKIVSLALQIPLEQTATRWKQEQAPSLYLLLTK